ncbi:MAG: dUTP diphosphatase [Clostridiales bacterium]|nr:dUTP diphosphatase [Clostridiales bacterium]
MKLLFKKLKKNATIPTRGTLDSAGLDLSACITEPLRINPQEIVKIPTGLSVEFVGEEKVALLIYARSSLAVKYGLTLANSVGVVDLDYRGEIIIGMINLGKSSYEIQPNERIAQLVVTPILMPDIVEVSDLSDTQRGQGGFGSTKRF